MPQFGVTQVSGRYPLVIKVSKQVLSYFNGLKSMTSEDDCLVKYAFNEQKSLNMSWYRRINPLKLKVLLQTHSNIRLNYPSQLRSRLMGDFERTWDSERQANHKLVVYNSFKSSFGSEKYLYAQLGYKHLKRTAQFRKSSHKYNIETGRYGSKYGNVLNRICEHCSTKESPFFEPVVEDEFHVLNSCSQSRYVDVKTKNKD